MGYNGAWAPSPAAWPWLAPPKDGDHAKVTAWAMGMIRFAGDL